MSTPELTDNQRSALEAVADNTCFVQVSGTLIGLGELALIESVDPCAEHRCGWVVTEAGRRALCRRTVEPAPAECGDCGVPDGLGCDPECSTRNMTGYRSEEVSALRGTRFASSGEKLGEGRTQDDAQRPNGPWSPKVGDRVAVQMHVVNVGEDEGGPWVRADAVGLPHVFGTFKPSELLSWPPRTNERRADDELRRLRDDVELLSRWIVNVEEDVTGTLDHACAQCVPNGPIVIESFVCARHRAKTIQQALAEQASRDDGGST